MRRKSSLQNKISHDQKISVTSIFFIRLLLLLPLIMTSCSSSDKVSHESSFPLENTKWFLKALNGEKIFTPESKKDIFIVFNSNEKRVKGFAGCNTFSGTYSSDNNKIEIGPLAGTEMYCESMMGTESEFFKALGSTKKFKIKGNFLQLYDSVKMIAKLEGIQITG